jgi:antitoxin (DNA-binding transcriptional repressor) of toxin-antitoxin stability system
VSIFSPVLVLEYDIHKGGEIMNSKTIDLDNDTITLEQLLHELEAHPEIVLTRGSVPVARVSTTHQSAIHPQQRILGLNKGTFQMNDDFLDELPDSFWLGEEE